jgi:uncharacterized protein with FMN-binding domain
VRRIVIWLASTVTVVVLLFGYHTSTNTPATAASSASSAPATPSTTPSATAPPDPTSTPSASAGSSASSSSSGTKTYTGDSASTRWGPVQVEITVTDGKITKVDVPVSPSGNGRDVEINDRALPELVQETLAAQSADIDMVSGATVTSDGYVASLQSALDQAGI